MLSERAAQYQNENCGGAAIVTEVRERGANAALLRHVSICTGLLSICTGLCCLKGKQHLETKAPSARTTFGSGNVGASSTLRLKMD